MFNILGISGSPRKDGNTEILIKAALEPFLIEGHSAHTFFLSERKVSPCQACEKCAQGGICAVKDDFVWLLEKMHICDALIIGSPVYMRNITAQLKAVFDRFHCVFERQPFKGKVGGAIAVGGAPANAQGTVLNIIYSFFLSFGMYCVPAVFNGVSIVAMEKGEVHGQAKSLQEVRVLGENILALLERLKSTE